MSPTNSQPARAFQYLLRYAAFNDFEYQGKLAAAGFEPVGTAQVVEPSRAGLLDGNGQRAGQVVTVVMFKKAVVVESSVVQLAYEALKREDAAHEAASASQNSNQPGRSL